MQQVLDKNSKRRMIISTIAMIIVVVVCCVLVQTPLKGKAEAITDADYTILVTKTSNNNKYVLQKMKSDGSTGNFNNTETDNLPVSLDNSGKNIFFNNNEFKTSAKVALLIQTDIEINDTTNINISTTNADGIGLQVDGSLNITGSGDVSVSGGAKGIYTIGTLTINGTGVVNATGTTESGINCGSDITITSGTVNVTGGTQGIVAESNGINISGGKVIVNTIKESDTEDISASLYANTINISGGEIELHIEGLNTKGIYTLGTMSISGDSTNITVEGDVRGTSNSWEYSSIYVGTDMIMDAGSVTVNVTNKTDDTYITGLTTKGCLTVNGGQIDVIVDVGYGESAEIQYGQSDGILVNSNFNLNGGKVKAIANGQANNNASGIHVKENTTISSGELYVENNNPNYNNSSNEANGLFAEQGLTVKGGTITAKGITRGIYIDNGDINIIDGTVIVSAVKDGAHMIYSSGDIIVSGGKIEVDVNGIDVIGIYVKGQLTIGNTDTDIGPTIVVKGDIQNNDVSSMDKCGMYINGAFTVNSGNIIVDLKNTSNANYITGIYANSTVDISGGSIGVNVDVKQADGTFGYSDGMSIHGDMAIHGGKLISKTNGAISDKESSGVHAFSSLTINGGKIEFRNTNNLDTDNSQVNRIGLSCDNTLNINGGYVISQGMSKALLLKGSPNIKYATDTQYYSVTTLVTDNYDGIDLSIYNTSNDIGQYKFVEFGREYKNYIRYNVADNKLYMGDATSNIIADTDLLKEIGISIISKGNLKLNNMNFISNVEYGLMIEGNASIKLVENSENEIYVEKNINDSHEYGIYCTGTLKFEGLGKLTVTGYTQAIYASSITYESGTDYSLKPIGVGDTVNHAATTIYPSNVDYASAKYIEIGTVANYYLKYNANQGKMYKVGSGGGDVFLTTNNELVQGWSIGVDKTLILDDFNFATTAQTGLMIIGNCNITCVDSNSIISLYDTSSNYVGINVQGDIKLQGTGTLNLMKNEYTSNKYIGISSAGDITIGNGTYNIYGESYGIKASGKTLAINNANVKVKGNTQAIDVRACNIHAKVIGSANYDGTDSKVITDINTTYTSNYANYKYYDISPATITVNITWGSMEFSGQRMWEPSTHTYVGAWNAENDGDKVIVENTTTSNIPIYAQVKYTQENANLAVIIPKLVANEHNGALAVGSTMVGGISLTSGDNINVQSELPIGTDVTNVLSLNGMPSQDITTLTSIGNLSVILSDYEISN